jgi:hypothetical protein
MGDVFLMWLMSLLPVLKTDTNNTETSPVVSPAGPADLSSGQESQDTEVLLIWLEPDIQYRATVYSQAADGTEGQPQAIFFTTSMLNFVKLLQPETQLVHSFIFYDSGKSMLIKLFFFVALGFELRASLMLGRCSTN